MKRRFECELALKLIRESTIKRRISNEETKETSRRIVELNNYSQSKVFSDEILAHIFYFITEGPLFLQKNLIQVCKMWYFFCHTHVPVLQIGSKYLKIHQPELFMQKLRDTLLHPIWKNRKTICDLVWIENSSFVKQMNFRNNDLEICSFLKISKLHLEGMQWITTTPFAVALQNLSSSLEVVVLKNCIRLDFTKESLESMFFSGQSFSKLKNLQIESDSNPLLLHHFLDLWTCCNYQVFPVLDTLQAVSLQCTVDQLETYFFDSNAKRSLIPSLKQLKSNSNQVIHATRYFQPFFIDSIFIGTFSSLNLQLPIEIQHILLSGDDDDKLIITGNHPYVQTICLLSIQSKGICFSTIQNSFPNLRTVQLGNTKYPFKVLQQIHTLFQGWRNYLGLTANCLQFMLLVCEQIQQYQITNQLDTNLDEQMALFQNLSNSINSFYVFVKLIDTHYFFVSETTFGARKVRLDTRSNYSHCPILLFQHQLQLWFSAMIQLSYKLYYGKEKSGREIIDEITKNSHHQPKDQQDVPNIYSLIPNPRHLLHTFSILFTSERGTSRFFVD